jgi:hypothetical protein
VAIRRTEHAHFTHEQIETHIRDALALAADCGLTDEERVALLPGIFEKLSSKQIMFEEIGHLPNMVVPKGLG